MEKNYDYIIIGCGPAGLSSAQYAARSGLKTLVLDMAGFGGQVLQITELENYPGVFPTVDGFTFMQTMKTQAETFGATILQEQVISIDKPSDFFTLKTNKSTYQAKCVCIATGAIHKNLSVPGESEFTGRGVSYCATCDGPFFRNKKIIVIGGGDSACSEAIYLSSLSKDVKIVHRRETFRAQKALIDKMFSCGVEPIYNCVVSSINGNAKVESITLKNVINGEETTYEADGIFIFAGMQPQTNIVEMLPKDESGYIKTNEQMETMIPGLFAVGDVRSKTFRQIVTATSDGAIAAHRVAEILG